MKDKVLKYLTTMYECFKYSTKDMIIFPGSNLRPALLISAAILLISICCEFTGLPFFIGWKGSALALAFLTIISLIGGKD